MKIDKLQINECRTIVAEDSVKHKWKIFVMCQRDLNKGKKTGLESFVFSSLFLHEFYQ